MLPIRQSIRHSAGSVTLRAWPETVAEAHLADLLTFTATLGALREDWHEFAREDMESGVWAAFWRLVQASLERGAALPRPLTWDDRLTLLTAMWDLNSLEDAEGKLTALTQRAARMVARLSQGLPTTASTSS